MPRFEASDDYAVAAGADAVLAASIFHFGTYTIAEAKARPADSGPVVIHVETDPMVFGPDSGSWWDVPVGEVSELDSTREARATYEQHKSRQRSHLDPAEIPRVDDASPQTHN